MKKENKLRYHKEPMTIIAGFQKKVRGTLRHRKKTLHNLKAVLFFTGKSFEVSFSVSFSQLNKLDIGEQIKKVEFVFKGQQVMLGNLYLTRFSPPQFTGDTNSLYTKGFSINKVCYYRLMLPLKKSIQLHYMVDRFIFTTDLGYRSTVGTKATILGDNLYVSILEGKGKQQAYLSIESYNKQSLEIFSNKAAAVINGLGFLTGYLAGDFGYYFAYRNNKLKDVTSFYFCSFRETIRTPLTPIYTNPYGRLPHKRRIANSYYSKKILKEVSIAEFSILCEKLYSSMDFASAVILILEASVGSLLLMPGCFAIALERLSDLIIGQTKLKLAPIQSKALSKKIRTGFREIIVKHSNAISAESKEVLLTRIDQINQMTNKSRLMAPFKVLEIDLNAADERVLDARNDFLHGRFPDIAKSGGLRTNDQINRDLLYASYKFYTLLSMLILKWIGFDSYVVNYPRVNEQIFHTTLKEEYYRKV